MVFYKKKVSVFVLLVAVLALGSCGPKLPAEIVASLKGLPDKIDYNQHVKPILSDKCFSCHGPDKTKQKAGLRLDIQSFAYAPLPETPGKVAIDPGNLEGSEFYHRIISDDPNYKMPSSSSHLVLNSKEKAILVRWIQQGAKYKPHWAFVKPEKPSVPSAHVSGWMVNSIDHFIARRLESEHIQPSKQASKELLLRRLSLDLTGLPPTLEEIDLFLSDHAANAYEKQVERLLKSPHFGEKMAVDWLDLARFADSYGYTVDRIRDMSPYRDWVIQAYNQNMPYNQFIQWQLAGDLMPFPTKDMIIATAFNRLHQQNMEGGIIEEEFQTEYFIDRTNTMGTAILGLPIGCARCHDHKFDPITQKNYYELTSFFNRVQEAGQISWDDATPTPTLMLPTKEKEKNIAILNQQISDQEKAIEQTTANAIAGFKDWLNLKKYHSLSAEKIPQAGLLAYYNFDNGTLKSSSKPQLVGAMKRGLGNSDGDAPVFEKNETGKDLMLNGDQWMAISPIGAFSRSDPFTINLRVLIPNDFKEGVIFHKCIAERLYNYRGYHVYLKENKLSVNMSHTAPSNAISRVMSASIPRNKWIMLSMTYDGSSKANGLKLFLDGKELALETTMDQLTKDIVRNRKDQLGLQIGAWDRGLGFKGGKVDDLSVYNRVLTNFELKIIGDHLAWKPISSKNPELLVSADSIALKNYYVSTVDPVMLDEQKKLQQLRTNLSDSLSNIQEISVMQDMPIPRKTYLLKRGNYDAFGEEVFPNTPPSILPFPKKFPQNRYGLAMWLTDQNHPLTARVAVNRLWQNFFGTGLVKTAEDFGNQGELPSHPELFDWLAVSFTDSKWDFKGLCKQIVMSATYRQDSKATPQVMTLDPENRLLAHGPSIRLTAEMIRDNALMASGLINTTLGGKSIKPYQPDGLWEINNTSYKADTGANVYRRGIYVLVKRSVPNPTLATFDATSRSYCVVRRQKTNTPLQALVTLNDPTFVEAAKVMGEQITMAAEPEKAIISIYRKLSGVSPTSMELSLLKNLQASELQKFRNSPEKTKGWLSAGQYKINKILDPALVAANAVVASVILNSDATLTKR